MREREERWDARFMEVAKLAATWSKDPSKQVGAVIVDSTRRILGTGYNGFPRGVDDAWGRYADREVKLSMVVHAELNAILNAHASLEGATIYVTAPPCSECAKAIIQSDIERIVWCGSLHLSERWAKSLEVSMLMLDEAGIDVEIR